MTYRKKLIEVALPLDKINREAAREKSIRHGHPSTLHLWWARRPLATCRAVLFASLVDDPSSHPEEFPTEKDQDRERKRLFRLIEKLVKWENVNNEHILDKARAEILKSTNGSPPPVLDPFCGGGSIPLEAQRLGLKAYGSDLNPVAVLITKAMIEIPPRFAGQPPVNPDTQDALMQSQMWTGAAGLAEDVRYYGKWMHKEAETRIGHLYPKVQLPTEHGGGEGTVIAWLWARTVKCPNPACGAWLPLVSSFWLSKKTGRKIWLEPIVDQVNKTIRFEVKGGDGVPPEPTKVGRGARFRCLVCYQDSPEQHVKDESMAGRLGTQLIATIAEGRRSRIYLPASEAHVKVAESARPNWLPEVEMNRDTANLVSGRGYGFFIWADLFTQRQLTALTTFSDLVNEAREQAEADAIKTEGRDARSYADAVATYLAFGIDRSASFWSNLCIWSSAPKNEIVCNVFGRQALPMVWDFAEANPFSKSGGNFLSNLELVSKCIEKSHTANGNVQVQQLDAAAELMTKEPLLISTDPPYYDNIGYADLSDFFYLWLRRSLRQTYPDLFNLILVPKSEELVAASHRFDGDKKKAEEHFLKGLGKAFYLMRSRGTSQLSNDYLLRL